MTSFAPRRGPVASVKRISHSVRPRRSGRAGPSPGWRMPLLSAALLLASAGAGQPAIPADAAAPLRLCLDPSNLPFSSDRPDAPGLYREIGETLGQALGRPVTAVWTLTYFGKRAVRTTLLAGQCDAAIGLPADQDFLGPRVIFSKPLIALGYALVTRKDRPARGLADLKGQRVAVQFRSTPQDLLALDDGIHSVTFREPDAAMQALAEGKVDAAFIWGPVAGYLNQTRLNGAFAVQPVAGPGLQFSAAIGFARGSTALRDEIDRAIDGSAAAIDALKSKYGFPLAPPVQLAANDATASAAAPVAAEPAAPLTAPAAVLESGAGAATIAAVPAPAAAADEADLTEGREIFNGICSHCHGPDAVQAERRINLRLLRRRYGDRMAESYRHTVTTGRPAKGMPNWSEVLTSEQIDKILVFLNSVQSQ
jgi:polar amino acid transport system substrate-binding protein